MGLTKRKRFKFFKEKKGSMMNKLTALILFAALSTLSAFAPVAPAKSVAFTQRSISSFPETSLNMVEDMTWEGKEYPPSKVLGPILSKIPSGTLGILAILSFAACAISCTGSAELMREPGAMATGSWVRPQYIIMGLGGPFAWGFHVAAWIQRMNGK